MSQAVMVAFYARVSSDQQAKRGTIESQIAALMERIVADGVQVMDWDGATEHRRSGASPCRNGHRNRFREAVLGPQWRVGDIAKSSLHGASRFRQNTVARLFAPHTRTTPQCRCPQEGVLNRTYGSESMDRDTRTGDRQRRVVSICSRAAC